MKRYLIALILIAAAGAAFSAPNFFGTSGNIITPDDTVLGPGAFSANFHVIDFESDSTNFLGASLGITPNLEVGIGRISDGDDHTIVNGKYQLLAETASRPSVVVGVFDASSELDDDASFYVLIGKNLTSVASNIADQPSRPLHGVLGVGGGFFDGLFGALDWTLTDKISLIAELTANNAFSFNVGARVALTNELRGDIALIDGDDLGFGISYTKIGL